MRAINIMRCYLPFLLFSLIALACLFEPLFRHIAGYTDETVNLLDRFGEPSAQHWLGLDELGRDETLRLLDGGRISLLVGLAGAMLATLLGSLIGLIAGVRGGAVDAALMRVTDGVMTLPLLPLLIVLAAIDLTKLGLSPEAAHSQTISITRMILIVALAGWTSTARLVRGATLGIMGQDYVRAAQAMGINWPRLLYRHVLPNVVNVITVAGSFAIGHVMMLESALSFIGIGIQPPTPSWGNMLTNAQEMMSEAPSLAIYPGLLIFLTVIACNFIGDSLQRRWSVQR